MVKRMLDNHGFTLIEVIFTLSIIIVPSVFTLRMLVFSPPHLSFDQQCNLIIAFFQEAKTQALLNHDKIEILIVMMKLAIIIKETCF